MTASTHYLTRTEYTQAKSLASDALLAFNQSNHLVLGLIVTEALEAREGAREYDRDGSVQSVWSTLAHMATTMARGNSDRASDIRSSFFTSLESAKKAARS